MPYRLLLYMRDGSILESVDVAPNNPEHDYEHKSIVKEIYKTGKSMLKRLPDVIGFECKKTGGGKL